MLTVYIEKRDIDLACAARGVELTRLSCPIAQALKRMYPKAVVSVGTTSATIDQTVYDHGETARQLAWRFYCKKPVTPTVLFLIEREDHV